MSPQSDLNTYIRDRMCHAFGQPQESVGSDARWSLDTRPDAVSIHVLLTGPNRPTLWVFDPHDCANGVSHQTFAHREEVESVIAQIQGRLQRLRDGEQPR